MISRAAALGTLLLAGPAFAAPPVPARSVDQAPPEPESERSFNRRAAIFALGVGSLGGAVFSLGFGFGLGGKEFYEWKPILDERLGVIKAQGGRTPADDFTLWLADSRLDLGRRLMIGGAVAATVFLGLGAFLVAHSRKQGPLFARQARLSPAVGPHGVGLSLIGRF